MCTSHLRGQGRRQGVHVILPDILDVLRRNIGGQERVDGQVAVDQVGGRVLTLQELPSR